MTNKEFVSKYNSTAKELKLTDFFYQTKEFMPIVDYIADNYDVKNIYKSLYPDFSKMEYNFETMEGLVLEFFKDFSPKLYNIIIEQKNSPGVEFEVIEPTLKRRRPDSFVMFFVNEFVHLSPPGDSYGPISICHEYGHMASDRTRKYQWSISHYRSWQDDATCEVESLFVEKVFRDWLYENGVITAKDYNLHCKRNFDSLVYQCKLLKKERNAILSLRPPIKVEDFEKFSAKSNVKGVLKTLGRVANVTNANDNPTFLFRYILGEFLAQVLYDEYKVLPMSATKTFEEFIDKNSFLTIKDTCKMIAGDNYLERIKNTFARRENSDEQQ